jgi:uncharacterized BrkB/YihY/UPF0761 family membrane protein
MKKEMAGVGNEAGIVSVVFGIISIVIASGVGIIFGVVGLLFGMRQHKRNPTKWSKAGIVLSIIGIVLGIVVIVFFVKYAQNYLPLGA